LRFLRSGERHLPVIALTADATPLTARRCREAGMDDLITKPVDRIRLLAALARLCEPGTDRRPLPVVMAAPAAAVEPEQDEAERLPVLDAGMAATLAAEPEFLDRLYGAFAEDSQRALAEMHRSLAESDPAMLRDAAHSLRSAASNLGGVRLAALAGPLKTWGGAELSRNGAAAVRRIEDERARLLDALAALGPQPAEVS
jgi:two-component system sensor histidine kinase RpfC